MSKFKVGDRVITKRGYTFDGKECIVLGYDLSDKEYLVKCPDYHPDEEWHASESELTLLRSDNRKIVITADGSKTLARLYEGETVVKTKEAKCAPSDTYDFATGAELAFDRLIGRIKPAEKTDKPEYKPGDKVKVIGNTCCHPWKKGDILTLVKIYVPFAGGAQAWRIDEAGRENNYIREPDFEPYAEPAKAEPDKEPIKLYCTSYGDGLRTIRKGDICELDCAAKTFKFPDGYVSPYEYSSVEDFCKRNPGYAKAGFVPLVKRPAEAGEWVLPDGEDKPVKVDRECSYFPGCLVLADGRHTRSSATMSYLVLDGYKPEPEYYNGKVICVDTPWPCNYTVGKTYTVKDGCLIDDYGKRRPSETAVNPRTEPYVSFADFTKDARCKWIVSKGEQS